MATIPLYNEGRETRTGIRLRPVLAPTAAPKISAPQVTGGQMRSFMQPTIDPRPHVAAAQAAGYAGEAAMKIADVLGKFALAKFEVRNRLDVADAEDAMVRKLAEYETWKLQSPDPMTWEGKWAEMSGELPGEVMHERLSPAARDAIQERLTRFQGRAALRVGTDAAKQMFAIEGQRLNAGWMRAAYEGDSAAAREGISALVKLGHAGKDDAFKMELQAQRMVEEAAAKRLDEEVSVTHETALLARRDLKAGTRELGAYYGQENMDDRTANGIRARAQAALNRHMSAYLDQVAENRLDGRVPSDRDLDEAMAAGLVDAETVLKLRQLRVDEGNDPDEPKRLALVLKAIPDFNPGSDATGERELHLKQLMGTLGRDAYAVAASRLAAHLKPGEMAHGVPYARNYLRMMFQAGAFGEWETTVEVPDPKKPGETKTKVDVNTAAKLAAYRDLAQALDRLDRWGSLPENKYKDYKTALDYAAGLVPPGKGARTGAALFLGVAVADEAAKRVGAAAGKLFGSNKERLDAALKPPPPKEGSIETAADPGKDAPKPPRTKLDDKRDQEATAGEELPEGAVGVDAYGNPLFEGAGDDGTTVDTGWGEIKPGDPLPVLGPLPGRRK